MTLLVFSMLLAPSSRVSRVPTTTITWNGTTDQSDREKESNQGLGSTVISSPPTEAAKALST